MARLFVAFPESEKLKGRNLTENTSPLTGITKAHLDVMFTLEERDDAEALLLMITSRNATQMVGRDDRCRIAALKWCGGDVLRLCDAVDLYFLDYRDLLMQAGFGSDLDIHKYWCPDID